MIKLPKAIKGRSGVIADGSDGITKEVMFMSEILPPDYANPALVKVLLTTPISACTEYTVYHSKYVIPEWITHIYPVNK